MKMSYTVNESRNRRAIEFRNAEEMAEGACNLLADIKTVTRINVLKYIPERNVALSNAINTPNELTQENLISFATSKQKKTSFFNPQRDCETPVLLAANGL